MPVPPLPMSAEELARLLSRPLPGGPALAVNDLVLVEVPGPPGWELRLRARVTVEDQAWEVSFPVDPMDFDPDVVPASLVLVLRANLEEWWHTREHEPHTAAWGRRLS
jgi:hypothetical protein